MVLSYRAFRAALGLCAASLLLLTAANARAQDKPQPEPETVADTTGDTPRSTLTRFFELSRRGDYTEASQYLELPPDVEPARAGQLAKRLRLVIDHYHWLDLSKVSAATSGANNDGLSGGVDEIARLPLRAALLTAPVRLVRRADARWRFSRPTVQHIDDWYDTLPNRFLLDLMPDALLRMGPYNLLWAQWAGLLPFVLVVWMLGLGLSRTSRVVLGRIRRPQAEKTKWDAELLQRIANPLAAAFGVFAAYLLLPLLGLYTPAHSLAQRALHAFLLATFFWALARSVDIAGQAFARSHWGRSAPATRAMLLFASRVGKFMVAAFALVTLFSELGYPVTSLIAGLGVGGIAVALSAQKSLENLIGAFAIAVDQPFREGDFVRVDGMTGTVELIGMRSTRIRTLDRTLVSIPNGKLADMRIETFAARDRFRFAFTFGLTYATTEAQLRQILKNFDALLRKQPKLWPDGCSVFFKELGESAMLVEAGCWFATDDATFTSIREDLLLGLMHIVEEAGAAFAYPTTSVQLDTKPPTTAQNRPATPS
ncbi:MAG: hypothetical protein RL701_7141 [Pseudomonadota bacterium]